MTTYFPALAKYFTSDANVWRKEFYVFHFCSCICIATGELSLYYIGNFIYTYAHLEPNQTSTMELFCENSWRLKTVDCFCRKTPSKMYDWFLNTPLIWMYLVILRRIFSLHIPEYPLCHGLSKNHVAQTFSLYCTVCSTREMRSYISGGYKLIKSKRIVLRRHPRWINSCWR